jgi:hypothetical protein
MSSGAASVLSATDARWAHEDDAVERTVGVVVALEPDHLQRCGGMTSLVVSSTWVISKSHPLGSSPELMTSSPKWMMALQ